MFVDLRDVTRAVTSDAPERKPSAAPHPSPAWSHRT